MSWYRFHVLAYRADTMHLSLAEHGAYRLLIDHYMSTRLPLPDDDKALARIIGASLEEWMTVAPTIRAFFRQDGTKLIHKRCDAELNIEDNLSRRKSLHASLAASKRWNTNNLHAASIGHDMLRASGTHATRPDQTNKKKDSCPIEAQSDVIEKIQKRKKAGEPDEDFLAWYSIYPRHEGRGQAFQAWKRAIAKAPLESLVAGVRRYAEACKEKEARYIRLPATWLNGEGWLDEEGKRDGNLSDTIGSGPAHPLDEYDSTGTWIPELAAQKKARKISHGGALEHSDGAREIPVCGLQLRAQPNAIPPAGHEHGHWGPVEKLSDDRPGDGSVSAPIPTPKPELKPLDRADAGGQSGGRADAGPARPALERKRLIGVARDDVDRLAASELIEPSA